MKELKEAQMGIITVLAVMLVSMTKRLPVTRRVSSGITTLTLAGIVLLVAAGGASAVTYIDNCTTISGAGTYVITEDILNTTEQYCIYITAEKDVFLDGGGFCIDGGSPVANRIGIYAKRDGNVDNITITNVEVTNFSTGIRFKTVENTDKYTNVLVENCSVHDNGLGVNANTDYGIHFLRVCDSIITRNEVCNQLGAGTGCGSGGDGIYVEGVAGVPGCGRNVTITCNNVHNNIKGGIYLKCSSDRHNISYNYCWENGAVSGHGRTGGIVVRCMASNENTITYNNVSNNIGQGIWCRGDNNTIKFNTAIGNADTDIEIAGGGSGGDDNEVSYNFAPVITTCGDTTPEPDKDDCNNNFGVNNSCDTCTCGGTNSISCPFTCDSPTTSVYFDFDKDGQCSKDFADCACPCGSKCACCNPGVFNDSGTDAYKAACPLKTQYGTPGPDPDDCDIGIYATTKPDLVVASKSETWFNETHYNVSYRVQNIGNGTSIQSVACVYINGAHQTGSDQTIGGLDPTECSDVKTVGPFGPCTDPEDTIKVCADCTGTNNEWNETNNCTENKLAMRKPDLVITWAEASWTDKPNKIFKINHTVCNIGNATATGETSLKTKVTIDGKKVNGGAIPSLNDLLPGNCQTASRGNYNMSLLDEIGGDGILNITLMADGNLKVDEINETNNNRTTTFTYVSIIDVSISPCQASIGPYHTNRTSVFIILENIENYGSGTIDLEFDESVVEVDTITATGCEDNTTVTANQIGQGHWRVTAFNPDGNNNYVKFANVTFKPKGLPPDCSNLNLTVRTLYNTAFDKLHISPGTSTKTCKICIFELDPPDVTYPIVDPQYILNTNGRARAPDTRLSDLSVFVTDDTSVASVTINLTQILNAGNAAAVPMVLQSGTNNAGRWHNVTYADRDDGQDLPGVNLTHHLYVNATDYHGNSNTGEYIELTVLRRGDVVRDDSIDSADYLRVMMYTVKSYFPPDEDEFEFVAGVIPADDLDGVDAGDALYIAMYTVGLVSAP